MPLRAAVIRIVIPLAALSALAATGVSAGVTAEATPVSASHPVQLTGAQLAAALLPAAAFPHGFRYDRSTAYNSGNRLEASAAKYHLATMGCTSFSNAYGRSGFGETAVVQDDYSTLVNNYISTTGAELAQTVYQFAGGRAATAFWRGLHSIFARCPGMGLSSGKTTMRIFTVPLRGAQAFRVDSTVTVSQLGTTQMESLVAVTGHDVFETDAVGFGRPVPSSPTVRTLMRELIPRVLHAR